MNVVYQTPGAAPWDISLTLASVEHRLAVCGGCDKFEPGAVPGVRAKCNGKQGCRTLRPQWNDEVCPLGKWEKKS